MSYSKLLLYSLVLIFWLCTQIPSAYGQLRFPDSVARRLASRRVRYHHYLWHQVRANWHRFSGSTRDAFRDLGWAPPNPENGRRNNFAGEDFLFMHRQMMRDARGMGSNVGGWSRIPAPGQGDRVPSSYSMSPSNFKSNNYYFNRMRPIEERLTNPNVLRQMSLNDLGNQLETQIHNGLHQRWSAASRVGYRSRGQINSLPDMDSRWDNPDYDWLVDTYSSHVNPYFYRLHGWIDARVEDWRRANGLGQVRWRGTWTGGPMSTLGSVLKQGHLRGSGDHHGGDDDEEVGDILEKGVMLFRESGVPEIFFGDVREQPPLRSKKAGKSKRRRLCQRKRSS